MAAWVELRVHGVSGTPPEDVLGSAHVQQVAGDDRTRSFRPCDAQGAVVPGAHDQVLEAFHWGRWTSGSWKQAGWLLLAPFGIVNAAQFMLPPPKGPWSRGWHGLSGALLRLLALVLTALLAVGAAVILIDLGAWQWLLPRTSSVDHRLVLAVALAATAGMTIALSMLGRIGRGRLTVASADAPGGQLPGLSSRQFFDGDPDNPALRNLHRAAGLLVVAQLGLSTAALVHGWWAGWARWLPGSLLAATVLVTLLLGDPEQTTRVTRPGEVGPFRRTIARPVQAWWHGDLDGDGHGASGWITQVLVGVAGAAVALSVAAVCTGPARFPAAAPEEVGDLPALDEVAASVGIAGTVTVVLLLVAVTGLAVATSADAKQVPAHFRRFAFGLTAWMAASVGFFIGIGMTAGLSLAAQGALNRFRTTYPPALLAQLPAGAHERIPAVSAPPVLQRVAYAWGLTAALLAVLLVAAAIWLRVRRARFRARARAATSFPTGADHRLPDVWVERVGAAMQQARLKNHVVLLFTAFAVTGTFLATVATAGYLLGLRNQELPTWLRGVSRVSSPPGDPVTIGDVWIWIGTTTLLALGTAVVVLARSAARAESARRGLNVLWDVIAFWPRSVHPYVPPPYSQVVVPQLVRRIAWHLGEDDPVGDDGTPPRPWPLGAGGHPGVERVVLAGHSQGSLLTLTALLQLPVEARDQVRWITFGSQLRQQFPRAFPHYVTVPDLKEMITRHCWVSLYRDTDHIAGPVTSWSASRDGTGKLRSCRLGGTGTPQDDWRDPATGRRVMGNEWRLVDPSPSDRTLQSGAVAGLRKHGGYFDDPDWPLALAVALGYTVPEVSWTDIRDRVFTEPFPAGGRSPADEQRHRQPVEQRAQADAVDVGDHAGSGQVVPPRSGGQRDGRVPPPRRRRQPSG